MEKHNYRFSVIILVAALCGLAAGITGEIITRVYFLKDYSVPYFNNEITLADLDYNRASLIIRDAKKIVVNQDVKVEETINSIRPSLVGIFKKIEPVLTTSTSTTLLEAAPSYYKLDDPEMVALVVTSDGWVAVSLPDQPAANFKIQDYVAITSDRKIYELEDSADFRELPGNLAFFRLVGANNLPIKKIALRADISLGQSMMVINDFNNVLLTSLSSFQKTPAILSSDTLNARFTLAGELTDSLRNSFVFNLAGDLVAVIGSDKEVVPAFSYSYYWQSFFKKGNAYQPLLGVNYLDLSTAKPVGEINLEKGAWLISSNMAPAIVKGGPAEQAGLQAGDVITWINNREINVDNDLADIISSFSPGDNINVVYWRAGIERSVSIKLAEKKLEEVE